MIRFKKGEEKKFRDFESNLNVNDANIVGLIMVRNQEKNIITCIESIKKICDEIIVVDTGSDDHTVRNINKNFPDINVKQLNWIENYALMRNECLNFVELGDWVLTLDADEVLYSKVTSKELHGFVNYLEHEYTDSDVVCTFKQKLNDRPVFGRPERLFKKNDSIYYYGLVHEEVRSRRHKLSGIDTDLVLNNKGTSDNEVEKFNKAERYTSLLLKNIQNEPSNPRWVSLLAPRAYQHGYFSASKYKDMMENALFENETKEILHYSSTDWKMNSYICALLERYCLFFIQEDNFSLANKYILIGERMFPYDVVFTVYKYHIYFMKQEIENMNKMQALIDKVSKMNPEMIDEASQGSEEALDAVIIRFLINTRKYKAAQRFYGNISDEVVKKILLPETEFFNELSKI